MIKKIIDLTRAEREAICEKNNCINCPLYKSVWAIIGQQNCYYYDKKDIKELAEQTIEL